MVDVVKVVNIANKFNTQEVGLASLLDILYCGFGARDDEIVSWRTPLELMDCRKLISFMVKIKTHFYTLTFLPNGEDANSFLPNAIEGLGHVHNEEAPIQLIVSTM